MSIFEYDKELEEKKLRKAEFEAGREIGHEAGLAERFMAKCKRNRNRTKRSFTVKEPKANRNYKDTVFRMLFSDRKNLLSLYNAVNQTDYRNPEELEIVTLENAIYMGMKNDLAFEITVLFHLTEDSCSQFY